MSNCRFVNEVAATAFGVLLIHANSDTMRMWLWGELFDTVGHMYIPHYAIRAIVVVLLVFTVCSCIDYLRVQLLEKPLFAFYDKRVGNR